MNRRQKTRVIGRKLVLIIYDMITIAMAYFIALWIRFDCEYSKIDMKYLEEYSKLILIYVGMSIVVYILSNLYRSIWKYASYHELLRIFAANGILLGLHIGVTILYLGRMPVTYYVLGTVFQITFAILVRFAYRFVLLERGKYERKMDQPMRRIMLIGAGNAAQILLRDIKQTPQLNEKVWAIIDDDPEKWNRYIDGVKVYGGRNDILKIARELHIEKIYLAIPSAPAENIRDILNICKETGCELRNMPAMYKFATGEISVSSMKPVAIEDLLGREPIQVNMQEICGYIEGKVVLITGGGGSIGSELARQVAKHNPKQLIIFDVYENNAYDIQQELKKKYPYLNLVTLIGSVRDSRTMYGVFEQYHPNIVYHAAAHKHVPLMEDSPCEAIKNNAIGTYKTAYAAMMHQCDKFVLISTDKAVNPTNIMGASKRLCEMIIQTFDAMIKAGKGAEIPELHVHPFAEGYAEKKKRKMPKTFHTEYVAVRFGNVLGSNGSVIPLFRKQIEAGGPVTVTHPDIIRYFMTIPEAVSLVMQAGTYAKGGEIFVLDMGEPVKIADLAYNLIRLSGLQPNKDIKIEFTGLRPGEKLYEEKLMAEEGLKTTPNHMIHIGCPIPFDTELFLMQLNKLLELSYKNDDKIRDYVKKVVTTYHPA